MTQEAVRDDLFSKRRAGVLLHPTCLQGDWGILGENARQFVDFLSMAGIRVWQTLPIGPTHVDLSPYQSLSAHAGNPDFIDLAELVALGLLQPRELEMGARPELFQQATTRFFASDFAGRSGFDRHGYETFHGANDHWLADFALFCAIREKHPGLNWLDWPKGLRDRTPGDLEAFRREAAALVQRICFEQFLFHHQWQSLRAYAHERDVLLFGDIPIFVAHDSADVWANRALFKLDSQGSPTVVAGVPPDYFSPDGQHWGNPLYEWGAMAADGYDWWLRRLDSQRHLFDLIRIDHFRGFHAYWEIPAATPEPINGYWAAGPAGHFLRACFSHFPGLPLVAENLGIIGEEVEQLRRDFGLPGMTVLQFGFDGNPDNPHLIHNHEQRDLVYTGTHDNDTSLGWYRSLDDHTRGYVCHYLGTAGEGMPWPLTQAALRSVSWLSMIPMQDLLALGSEARFNTPGTTRGNWLWRLDPGLCQPALAKRIRALVALYGRLL